MRGMPPKGFGPPGPPSRQSEGPFIQQAPPGPYRGPYYPPKPKDSQDDDETPPRDWPLVRPPFYPPPNPPTPTSTVRLFRVRHSPEGDSFSLHTVLITKGSIIAWTPTTSARAWASVCPAQAVCRLAFFDEGTLSNQLDLCEQHAVDRIDDFRHDELASTRKQSSTSLGINCNVGMILMAYSPHHCAIYLRESGGNRLLPFETGGFEAWALYWTLRGHDSPRPSTHNAFLSTINALGGELTAVVVDNKLEPEGIYTAQLKVWQDNRSITVDVRPSDGVCLAAAADLPVLVKEELLNSAT